MESGSGEKVEDIAPPGTENRSPVYSEPENPIEADDEVFNTFMAGNLDVVDECGDSDEEKVKTEVEDKKPSRQSGSRRRSRSPRRPRERPKSRDRKRSRERDKKPVKGSSGGAASFLADLKKQFGSFEELEQVEKKGPTSIKDLAREKTRATRSPMGGPRRRKASAPISQYPTEAPMVQIPQMPMPMMMGGPMMDPNGYAMTEMCAPGTDPSMGWGNQMMGTSYDQMNMMAMQQQMQYQQQMQMGMQQIAPSPPRNDRRRRRSRSRSRSRRSRSRDRRRSRTRTPPGRRSTRDFKPRIRSRSRSRSRTRVSDTAPRRRLRSRSPSSVAIPRASGPIRTNIDLSEITSQLFLDNKIGLSDFLQTKISGSTGNHAKPMDTRLPLSRVISKLRAATHILDNKNDIQYNLKFLFVPPRFPATPKKSTAASPMFPSQTNPLFSCSTDRPSSVPECRPFSSVPANVTELVRHLGLDESVIADKLESNVVVEEFIEARQRRSHNLNAETAVRERRSVSAVQRDESPVCRRCEERERRKVNAGVQTKPPKLVDSETQTSSADLTLADIRMSAWKREQQGTPAPKVQYSEGIVGPPGYSNIMPQRPVKNYSYNFN